MSDQPDVLDHLGLVPRELGALHLFVEPVLVDEHRRAHVTALLQPAFEGRITGRLIPVAVTATGDRAVAEGTSLALPALDGQVLRWRFSFPLLAVPEEILFRLEAPVPDGAQRVRPAWKLLETFEQPKEVRRVSTALLEGGTSDLVGFGVHFGLGLAMGHLVLPLGGPVGSVGGDEGPRAVVRHAAAEGVAGFVAPVVAGTAPGPDEVEVVWRPGMALPEPPPPAPFPAPVPQRPAERAIRPCPMCGSDVEVAEAESLRMCPVCGGGWNF